MKYFWGKIIQNLWKILKTGIQDGRHDHILKKKTKKKTFKWLLRNRKTDWAQIVYAAFLGEDLSSLWKHTTNRNPRWSYTLKVLNDFSETLRSIDLKLHVKHLYLTKILQLYKTYWKVAFNHLVDWAQIACEAFIRQYLQVYEKYWRSTSNTVLHIHVL